MICGGVAAAVAATALAEAIGLVELPEALDLLDRRLPGLFRIHMASSALALALIPLAIATSGALRFHRPLARAAALTVLIGGATALPAALLSAAPLAARLGFFAQAIVWLGFLAAGVRAIRRRDRAGHRRSMLMLAAVAAGAALLRFMLALIAMTGADFELGYGLAAWLAWLAPAAAVWRATSPGKRRASV